MQFIGEHTTSNAVLGIVSVDLAQWRCHLCHSFLLIAIHFQLNPLHCWQSWKWRTGHRHQAENEIVSSRTISPAERDTIWCIAFRIRSFFPRDQASWLDRKRKVRYYEVVQVAESLSRQTEDLCRIMVVLCERKLGLDYTLGQCSLRRFRSCDGGQQSSCAHMSSCS